MFFKFILVHSVSPDFATPCPFMAFLCFFRVHLQFKLTIIVIFNLFYDQLQVNIELKLVKIVWSALSITVSIIKHTLYHK